MCTRPKLVEVTHAYFYRSGMPLKYKFAPCGMCLECRNMRREEYTQRLKHEIQTSGYIASFVSLTYRDDELPLLLPVGSAIVGNYFGSVPPAYGSTLSRKDISQFCDKLQKRFHRKFGKKTLKYIAVGEYGDDCHRPHYHLIVVGLPCSERDMIYNAWSKGRVDIEPVGNGAIRYCLEYIDKQVFGADSLYEYYGDFEPPFAHFSKGIGADWIQNNLDKFNKYGRIDFADSGKSYTLNPYYRRKYGFDLKPYVTPYSDSVIKYAVENNISLLEALEKRCKIKEQSLVHKQIKKREPITNCSKYIIQKEINKYKNKGLYDNPDVQAQFTKALLKADDYLISNPDNTTFPMSKQTEYDLKYIKNKNALIQLSLNNSCGNISTISHSDSGKI